MCAFARHLAGLVAATYRIELSDAARRAVVTRFRRLLPLTNSLAAVYADARHIDDGVTGLKQRTCALAPSDA